MTPPEPQTPDVPEGMKPWAGGDHAPDDWDGGPVLRRMGTFWDGEVNWDHIPGPSDIIAYTPCVREQPAIVGGVDREAGDSAAVTRLKVMCDHGRIDAAYGDFAHPTVTMIADVRNILTARPSAPAEVRPVEPSQADIHRAHNFLRSLRKPTINSNVPASVAVQAMFYWHQQETEREREDADMAGLAHAEVAGEVGVRPGGDGSDSGRILGPDNGRPDSDDCTGTLEVASPAPVEPGSERERIARIIALHGLGTCNGMEHRGPPNTSWTQAEWERRILECVPQRDEQQCYALADAILTRPAADDAK